MNSDSRSAIERSCGARARLAGTVAAILTLTTSCPFLTTAVAHAQDVASTPAEGAGTLAMMMDVDIPAQDLGDALIALSRQSGTQILVATDAVRGQVSPAVRGRMSVGSAIEQLIAGTDLEARSNGARTINLTAPSSKSSSIPGDALDRRVVEEIIVTANRRAQNVQDIAGGIRVFDGEALEKSGTAGLADYVFKIPGADIVDDGVNKKLALRGVSNMSAATVGSGGTASPIGLYLNDTPIQGNGNLPDMGLYDLERIEVLKGPQGTLYGEGAQGGAFKMLLNTADPSELSAKGEVTVGRTVNGSGIDHSQKVALNVPIFGTWATRWVGTRQVDQGFVDYFNRGAQGEDDATNLMGRVHVDGDIWDGFSASLMILHQRQRLDQFAQVQMDEGDLRNRYYEPQFMDTDFTLGGVTLDYDLGFATATSSTSVFRNDREMLLRTAALGTLATAVPAPFSNLPFEPPTVAPEQEWHEVRTRQFGIAQELRLVSSGDSWLDWTGGLFYRKRSSKFGSYLADSETNDVPPPTGPGTWDFRGVESFEQVALFGEATLELPWSLELTLGLRGSREDAGLEGSARFGTIFYAIALAAGEVDGTFPSESFGITTKALTPKVSLSWVADEWRMLYATFAQGVRSGGTNPNSLYETLPPLFEPDTLSSYEIGAKTQWLDGLVTANVAAFYNDWRDLQVAINLEACFKPQGVVCIPGVAILNAGRAFSRGLELELGALPLEDLTLGFNLFIGDGEIVDGDVDGSIPDHSPLPQLAKLSYGAFAAYEASRWPLFGFTPSLVFDTQATGERTAAPPVFGADFPLPGFQTFNAQVGLANERWEVTFGVRNLTDTRQQLGLNLLETDTLAIGRPRAWTLRLAFRWG